MPGSGVYQNFFKKFSHFFLDNRHPNLGDERNRRHKPIIDPPYVRDQGGIFRLSCSHRELTKDHVLTSAYVKIFRTVTRNAVNKSVWRKKDCSWPPLNKYAMNIWLSSLKIRAHLSWRTGKHLHVLHVLRTYSTCSCPGQQDTTTYAALRNTNTKTKTNTKTIPKTKTPR